MTRFTLLVLVILFSNKISAQTASDIENALIVHNKARDQVGVSYLIWSDKLAEDAQQYAEYLALNNKFEHSGASGYGENLYWSSGYNSSSAMKLASEAWYNEIKDYSYGPVINNQHFSKIGHYTQMVWKNTQAVGIGVAIDPDGDLYVVARYYPPGNFIGQYPY